MAACIPGGRRLPANVALHYRLLTAHRCVGIGLSLHHCLISGPQAALILDKFQPSNGNSAVFQGACADRKWMYDGEWTLRVLSTLDDAQIVDHSVVLIHSESAGMYWGYSAVVFPTPEQTNRAISAEVVEFAPENGRLSMRMVLPDHKELAVEPSVSSETKGKRFVAKDSDAKYKVTLARPR